MNMFKKVPVFILLFTGYLCNAQETTAFSPTKGVVKYIQNSSPSPTTETPTTETPTTESGQVPSNPESDLPSAGRSLPALVVAGVSIALVLLCILIVAVFWYAWKKSQEGSIELNPIPYGEAGAFLRNLPVPENQQERPFERAVQ